MKHYSFMSLAIVFLFLPALHAMEQSKLITPDSFTDVGKKYIYEMLDASWVISFSTNITTGLAGIFSSISENQLPALLQDVDALEKANAWYAIISKDPIFALLPAFYQSHALKFKAKDFGPDILNVITQLAITKLLTEKCPEVKIIAQQDKVCSGDPIALLEFYTLNAHTDQVKCAPYVRASVLLAAYLTQMHANQG
jgi:hypothetical protein